MMLINKITVLARKASLL